MHRACLPLNRLFGIAPIARAIPGEAATEKVYWLIVAPHPLVQTAHLSHSRDSRLTFPAREVTCPLKLIQS